MQRAEPLWENGKRWIVYLTEEVVGSPEQKIEQTNAPALRLVRDSSRASSHRHGTYRTSEQDDEKAI